MIRLPDPLFSILERVLLTQRRIRREEGRRELERQDRALRERCARESAAHDSGDCGGEAGGCRYYPCYSVRDGGWGR